MLTPAWHTSTSDPDLISQRILKLHYHHNSDQPVSAVLVTSLPRTSSTTKVPSKHISGASTAAEQRHGPRHERAGGRAGAARAPRHDADRQREPLHRGVRPRAAADVRNADPAARHGRAAAAEPPHELAARAAAPPHARQPRGRGGGAGGGADAAAAQHGHHAPHPHHHEVPGHAPGHAPLLLLALARRPRPLHHEPEREHGRGHGDHRADGRDGAGELALQPGPGARPRPAGAVSGPRGAGPGGGGQAGRGGVAQHGVRGHGGPAAAPLHHRHLGAAAHPAAQPGLQRGRGQAGAARQQLDR